MSTVLTIISLNCLCVQIFEKVSSPRRPLAAFPALPASADAGSACDARPSRQRRFPLRMLARVVLVQFGNCVWRFLRCACVHALTPAALLLLCVSANLEPELHQELRT